MHNIKLSRALNVQVPADLIQELVNAIVELSERGEIRTTADGQYSVYDVIARVVGKGGEHKVWKRLQQEHFDTLTNCQSVKLPRSDGKLANASSPVTDLAGCIEIIWLLPGETANKLRKVGAEIVSKIVEQSREETLLDVPTVAQIAEATQVILSIAGIHPNLIAGSVANSVAKYHPKLKGVTEDAKKLLPLPVQDELLTVTNLAKKYREMGHRLSSNDTEKGNAIAMNKLLIASGMQIENPNEKAKADGQPTYLPTEAGKRHSQIVLQQAKDSQKTTQQLRWRVAVLDLLLRMTLG